jgi:hypothetical protein
MISRRETTASWNIREMRESEAQLSMQEKISRGAVKSEYMCAVEACRAKEWHTHTCTRDFGPRRRRPSSSMSCRCARAPRHRLNGLSKREVRILKGSVGMFATIDTTEHGETVEEGAYG